MKRQSAHLFIVAILALLGPLAQKGLGDFILWNDESLTVNSSHSQGILYDTSRVFIVSGGHVGNLWAYNSSIANISGGYVSLLYAYDYSVVDISGGSVNNHLYAYDFSTVNLSGGSIDNNPLNAYDSSTVNFSGGSITFPLNACDSSTVNFSSGYVSQLYAHNSSTVNFSGGSVSNLEAYDTSTVNISGGNINASLSAYDSSTVIFYGRGFRASGSLVLDGERVLGTGILSGEWMDGTRWAMNITQNPSTATILAISEPTHILTIDVDPNDIGIDTITPSVGAHGCGGWVNINSQQFTKCPDVYVFDHWEGDVNDPNSTNTTVFMDTDKTVTAVFVDSRKCGDECHPYPIGDLDKDCVVTFGDFALFASHWLDCTKPECD